MKRFRGVSLVVCGLAALLALLVALPTRADFGTGWTATFFNSNNLTGTSVTVAAPSGINFNWGTGSVAQSGVSLTNCADAQNNPSNISADCSNFFSARFTSTQAIAPGTYNFIVSSDDGVRVYINGALRLDKWVGRPLTTDTFTETITTTPVNITVEYFENTEGASLQVQWFLQGAPGTLVGTPLFTPIPVATTIPFTVQVEGVRGLSIRTGPYLGASFVGAIVPGTPYSPTARNTDEGGGYTWYYITAGDKSGWVSGRYLAITGDPNSVPIQGTIFDQIDGAPAVDAYASPRSVMNFRRRPSARAASLGQIPWGANVELIGRTVQGGNNFWLHVRYNGQVGWIYAPFVSVSGNINAVPIY